MGLNVCFFSGRIVGNTELRYSQSGSPFLKFTVSVMKVRQDERKYTPFFCTMFGDRAEKLQSLLVKGAGVAVTAAYDYNEYTDSSGNKKNSPGFLVNDVDIIKYAEDSEEGVSSPAAVKDEDLPF